MSTLLLTRSDVARHLEALTLLEELREGFREHSTAKRVAPQRPGAAVHRDGRVVVATSGLLDRVPAYGMKVQAQLPREAAPEGVLHLLDQTTGAPLAVMEAGTLTALRSGLTAALSADVLARPDASRVALIGAGRVGSVTLKCLRLVRSLTQVSIYDPDVAQSEALATRTYQSLSLPASAAKSIEEAVLTADIVVSATLSREPIFFPGMLRHGCHLISLGADEPGKVEFSAPLIRQSKYFVDDRELTKTSGTLAALGLDEKVIAAELGEVIAGIAPGRTAPEEITLFSSAGLPSLDLLAAWSVYQSAKQDESIQRIDFGA